MRQHPYRRGLASICAATFLVLLAACSSSTPSPSPTPSPTAVTDLPTATSAATVTVQDSRIGRVLADADGLTLYILTADPRNGSACTGQCATAWPPLMSPRPPDAPSDVTATFTVFDRPDGGTQVAANGRALYTFMQDTAPGEVKGQAVEGAGGTWYAMSATGQPITR